MHSGQDLPKHLHGARHHHNRTYEIARARSGAKTIIGRTSLAPLTGGSVG